MRVYFCGQLASFAMIFFSILIYRDSKPNREKCKVSIILIYAVLYSLFSWISFASGILVGLSYKRVGNVYKQLLALEHEINKRK